MAYTYSKKKQTRGHVYRGQSHSSMTDMSILLGSLFIMGLLIISYVYYPSVVRYLADASVSTSTSATHREKDKQPPSLDRGAYRDKMYKLADYDDSATTTITTNRGGTTATSTHMSTSTVLTPTEQRYRKRWPVTPLKYPKAGAILPFHRVVAFYGNFYSTQMGILGKYKPEKVLKRLRKQVAKWEAADPDTPVKPAIHYIAVTAQSSAGPDGMYRNRMPDDQIEKALTMADKVDGIVFLDIQIGLSSLKTEIKKLREYLKQPNVHLAIDPEFSMKKDRPPGHAIGVYDAADINFASAYLADLVNKHDLPPKILVVHRFTKGMVRNAQQIKRREEVQTVMHMDGWGSPSLKRSTWRRVIEPEPVQFTGFKVFFENDRKPPSPGIMSPEQILDLRPDPIYIQYQ